MAKEPQINEVTTEVDGVVVRILCTETLSTQTILAIDKMVRSCLKDFKLKSISAKATKVKEVSNG
jgi:hypothetical protein